MGSQNALFSVPIAPLEAHEGGSIDCTEPAPQVYLLTWSSPPDNRLTPSFLRALLVALDIVEFTYPPGVVVTTSAITKFYSNGLDLAFPLNDPKFWEREFWPVLRRLLTYSMPTVALMNGHAFAGAVMLAMHHDYRVFTDAKGYICVNELDFGAPLPPPLASIFRHKTTPNVFRKLVLEAHRFNGQEALGAGIVDAVGGLEAALKLIKDLKLTKKGTTGVYNVLKTEMYREQLAELAAPFDQSLGFDSMGAKEAERRAEGKKKVEEWKKANEKSKSKL